MCDFGLLPFSISVNPRIPPFLLLHHWAMLLRTLVTQSEMMGRGPVGQVVVRVIPAPTLGEVQAHRIPGNALGLSLLWGGFRSWIGYVRACTGQLGRSNVYFSLASLVSAPNLAVGGNAWGGFQNGSLPIHRHQRRSTNAVAHNQHALGIHHTCT